MTRARLVMTLLVRDEADIVAHNVEFHLAQGVDHVIAIDNASVDGTHDILEAYQAGGVLTLYHEPSLEYRQDEWATRMARIAHERFGPCWLISNDADEFWTAPSGDLTEGLDGCAAQMIRCSRRNMLTAHDWLGFVPWYEELIFTPTMAVPMPELGDLINDPLAEPYFYHALPDKMIFHTANLRMIARGAHGARYDGSARIEPGEIVVSHYSVRSRAGFSERVDQVAGALKSREHQVRLSWKYRRWGEMAERAGDIEPALFEALPDGLKLNIDLMSGVLTRDTKLVDTLSRIDRRVRGYAAEMLRER